ncbi:MAG: ABC transporter permease [bacterium]|nr:ABC transporter permease [bacterium]
MGERTSNLQLIWQQIRYQNKIFWRTPIAAFFTIVFPLMFLFVFVTLFGNDTISELGVTTAQFYAPALAVFGAVSATYTNLAIGTAISRDEGILKRVRGTPLPPWIYMAGRVGSSVWVAFIAVVLMLAVGVLLYGVEIYLVSLPALLVAFAIGVACFASLGLVVAAFAPSGDAAPAIANATLLPLAFISDIFIAPSDASPGWLAAVGSVFPLKHFAVAFSDGFSPIEKAARDGWLDHFHWKEYGIMALWLVGGVILAIRFFTWEPRGGERKRSSRKRAKTAAEA